MYQIIYPNLEGGNSKSLENYILEICNQHKEENRALAFAFIISDLDDPQITKILRDNDYLQALHKISGNFLTIFYLNDNYVNKTIQKAEVSNIMYIEFGVQRIDAPNNYSPKYLAKNLLNKENLHSPSILFFQVKDNNIIDYTFAQIRKEKIEEAFNEIKGIIKTAIDSLKDVKSENILIKQKIYDMVRCRPSASGRY